MHEYPLTVHVLSMVPIRFVFILFVSDIDTLHLKTVVLNNKGKFVTLLVGMMIF